MVVNYASSKEGADKVVAEIKAKGGKAVAVQGDFSKQEDIGKVFGGGEEDLWTAGYAGEQCRCV